VSQRHGAVAEASESPRSPSHGAAGHAAEWAQRRLCVLMRPWQGSPSRCRNGERPIARRTAAPAQQVLIAASDASDSGENQSQRMHGSWAQRLSAFTLSKGRRRRTWTQVECLMACA